MVARKLMVIALLVPAFMALVASPASAQGGGSVQIDCSNGPQQIQPLGAPGQWDCTAQIQFPRGLGDPTIFYTLTLRDQDSPSWANVIISPGAISGQWEGDGETTQTRNFKLSVGLTANAPAFEPTRVTIGGEMDTSGSPQQFTVAQTQITVTPGYFNLYNVRMDKKIGQGGPQDSVDYPIQIDNFSNGQTRFEFELVSDEVPTGFQPVVPEPVVLESQAGGGEQTQGQVTFSVYTPFQNGYVNDVGAIQLRVKSFYAPDTSIQGATSQVSTLTQARGFYVPGPAAPLLVLGVLGAAVGMAKVRGPDE